jgi:hypothetical protein
MTSLWFLIKSDRDTTSRPLFFHSSDSSSLPRLIQSQLNSSTVPSLSLPPLSSSPPTPSLTYSLSDSISLTFEAHQFHNKFDFLFEQRATFQSVQTFLSRHYFHCPEDKFQLFQNNQRIPPHNRIQTFREPIEIRFLSPYSIQYSAVYAKDDTIKVTLLVGHSATSAADVQFSLAPLFNCPPWLIKIAIGDDILRPYDIIPIEKESDLKFTAVSPFVHFEYQNQLLTIDFPSDSEITLPDVRGNLGNPR